MRISTNVRGTNFDGALSRAVNWFRDLPSVPKLALVGLVLLALVVVLSPVMRVVAIIAFLVSVAVLILRAVQRRPVKRWGVAALASLVLILVLGGISGALYDNGFGGSGGVNPTPPAPEEPYPSIPQISTSDYDAFYDMGPVLAGTPRYGVRDVEPGNGSKGVTLTVYMASSYETCRNDMRLLMEDVAAQTQRFDSVAMLVLNLGSLDVFEEGNAYLGGVGFDDRGDAGSLWGEGDEYTETYREGRYQYTLEPVCYE